MTMNDYLNDAGRRQCSRQVMYALDNINHNIGNNNIGKSKYLFDMLNGIGIIKYNNNNNMSNTYYGSTYYNNNYGGYNTYHYSQDNYYSSGSGSNSDSSSVINNCSTGSSTPY